MSNFKRSDDNVTAILEEYLSKDELNSKDKKSLSEKISIRCGVDLSVWKIDNFRIVGNLWTVHGKFGSVEEGNQRWDEAKNRQLKIIIAYKRIAPDNANTFVKDFLELLTEKSPVVKKIHEYNINNGAMMMPDSPDLHLGRLSYGKETGENYDIKIATQRIEDAYLFFYDEAKYLAKRHPVEKILMPYGNDFLNYDYSKPYPHTSNNTPQESDVRFQKMFTTGTYIAINQIEAMSYIAPVKVIIIPGNHDEQTVFYLGMVLHAYFKNNENVEVEVSPKLRKYESFGKNMLGFSHGQYEGFERLFANMSLEEMQMWANSQHKYMFTGHRHHKEVRIKIGNHTVKEYKYPKKPTLVTEDLNGVLIDSRASLTSNDYHEASRGYIHIKGAECPIFDKERGKFLTLQYGLPISIGSK